MKIRFHIFVLFIILKSGVAFSQKAIADTTHKFSRNEVSFDMFYFLNIFRPNFSPTTSSGIMSFAFERHLTPENLIRLGTDIILQQNRIQTTGAPRAFNNSKTYSLLRLGLEKEKDLWKGWVFYFGVDLVYQYQYIKNESGSSSAGISTSISDNNSYGVSPLIGVKFEISPRISFSMETEYEILRSNSRVTNQNDIYPQNNSVNHTHNFFTVYAIPQNIFLNVKF